jgi:UDP-2,4-diacetamido-2,4,6-trideoxy-beta-L-altropyranose hydrolase
MKRALIRCDASTIIGSGHVIRCRTLGRALKHLGWQVVFICRRQEGDLISLLEKEFQVVCLHRLAAYAYEQPPFEPLEDEVERSRWLGCSQQKDAIDTMRALAQAAISVADVLVIDHYGLDFFWEGQLIDFLRQGDRKPVAIVIDDLADRAHVADMLIDQNFYGESTARRYSSLVNSSCETCLGPSFALLSPEYEAFRLTAEARTSLRTILLVFGGVDSHNYTERFLQELTTRRYSGLKVNVVIGHQNSSFDRISKLVHRRPNTYLHARIPSLSKLIAEADISIGAGGTTVWEKICLGLPSLSIPVASNQINCINELNRYGYVKKISSISEISEIFNVQLMPMSIRCLSLLDGKGCTRVLNKILLK